MVGISTDDEKEYLCVSNYHSMNRTGQCQLFPLSQVGHFHVLTIPSRVLNLFASVFVYQWLEN